MHGMQSIFKTCILRMKYILLLLVLDASLSISTSVSEEVISSGEEGRSNIVLLANKAESSDIRHPSH